MKLIQYVTDIGLIFLVIIYGLKLLQLSVLLLLSFLRSSKKVIFWVNTPLHAFGTYLLVLLTSKVTLIAISGEPHPLLTLWYITIGVLVIYLSEANGIEARYERIHSQQVGQVDWTIVKYTDITDGVLLCGALILYVVSVFRPTPSPQTLTGPILGVIGMASKVVVVNLLVRGLGIVNLIGIAMGGCSFSRRLLEKILKWRAGGLVGTRKSFR